MIYYKDFGSLHFNPKHRYKMLSLPNHFTWQEDEGEPFAYQELVPLFHRNGWFYDRYTRLSWVEYEGKGYVYLREADFKYHLKLENAKEHRLNDNMCNAVKLLIKEHLFDYKRKQQYIDLMQMENELRYFRESNIETKKWYNQYVKDNPV